MTFMSPYGRQNLQSDLDILVVINEKFLPSRQEFLRGLFHDYPVKVNVLIYTQEDSDNQQQKKYSFIYSILKNCITLYEIP